MEMEEPSWVKGARLRSSTRKIQKKKSYQKGKTTSWGRNSLCPRPWVCSNVANTYWQHSFATTDSKVAFAIAPTRLVCGDAEVCLSTLYIDLSAGTGLHRDGEISHSAGGIVCFRDLEISAAKSVSGDGDLRDSLAGERVLPAPRGFAGACAHVLVLKSVQSCLVLCPRSTAPHRLFQGRDLDRGTLRDALRVAAPQEDA